jgi:hypothetical protein
MTVPRTFGQKVARALHIPENWVAPLFTIFVITIGVIAIVVVQSMFPTQPSVQTEYQAIPLEISHVEHDANKSKVSRGYKIVTPDWIVVTDIRTSYNPEGTCPPLSKAELAASRNLAAHCEVAKQRNEPVIIFGVLAKEGDGQTRMLDGKPVLLARRIVYAGKEFILYPE